MTDDAFLAALAETPNDAALRAVYADFLDDAGKCDAAEVLRADEAMRRVPVWSDEYWTLKTRRNALRRLCPGEWIRATRLDGSRPERLFRDGYPDSTRDRWRFVRAFTEVWHGVEMPDVGGPSEAVAAEEKRLGLNLGASLRELVAFQGDLAAHPENYPLASHEFVLYPINDQTLSVMRSMRPEEMSVAALRTGEDDPPVDLHRYVDGGAETWYDEIERGVFNSVTGMAMAVVGAYVEGSVYFTILADEADAAFGTPLTAGGPAEPRVWYDASGVLAVYWGWPDRQDNATVYLHSGIALREVPREIREMSRRAIVTGGGYWRWSDEEIAQASALFDDDPPVWFTQFQANRAAIGQGAIPF